MRKSRTVRSLLLCVPGLVFRFASPSLAAEVQQPSTLLRKLTGRAPVTYVALGDSITQGYELSRGVEEAFATQFSNLLVEAFHHPRIRYINAGVPGDTVSQGLNRLPPLLKKYHPDLMTVQFGGNDYRDNTTARRFREDLRSIITTARKECGTTVIVLTPPMGDDALTADSYVVRGVREVAEAEGALLVDADTELKKGGVDFRGLFPVKAHPTAYSHRRLCSLVWNSFSHWLDFQAPVSVKIKPMTVMVDTASPIPIPVQLRNLSEETQPCAFTLSLGPVVYNAEATLEPKREQQVVIPVSLPDTLKGTRTLNLPVRVGLWAGKKYACSLISLSLSPVVLSVAAGASPTEGKHDLDFTNIVTGKYNWDDPADLSAHFRVTSNQDTVEVVVSVQDDLICPASEAKPYDGDSLEVYLDLRKAADQGRPFFDKDTLIFYLIPKGGESGSVSVLTSEPEPKKHTEAQASSKLTPDGYEITLRIPRKWLETYGDEAATAFGFDLAVNDGDDRYGRETQLTWAGTDQDFLNPGLFGALTLGPVPLASPARLTIQ